MLRNPGRVAPKNASRWSRDNLKNKIGLSLLRKNGIRFFVGTMEYDLYNPEHILFLGMSAELGEFQAKQQALKSIVNKIERSKRGIPCTGKLPYGRTYSRDKGWGIDEAKASKIRNAAERYLNGESFISIAQISNMSIGNLWTILNHRSGTKWEVKFDSKQLNIKETIEIEIPSLLDDSTIEAIKEKAVANRTYTHGEIKNRYLLSRMIFCAKCGLTLFGMTTKKGRRYYRHPSSRYRNKDCSLQKYIPGDLIENSVLIHLIQTFGDIELLRKAVERATPDLEKMGRISDERSELEQEMKKNSNQKERIVDMVAEGILSRDEVKEKIEKLRERGQHIKNRLMSIKMQIDAMPDPKKVKRLSQLGLKILGQATQRPQIVFKRPYEWKRKLLEHAFGGRNAKGQRLGVYVSETGNPKQPWQIEVRGILETTCIALPLEDEYLEDSFNLDHEYQDVKVELEKIKESITNFSSLIRQVCSCRWAPHSRYQAPGVFHQGHCLS